MNKVFYDKYSSRQGFSPAQLLFYVLEYSNISEDLYIEKFLSIEDYDQNILDRLNEFNKNGTLIRDALVVLDKVTNYDQYFHTINKFIVDFVKSTTENVQIVTNSKVVNYLLVNNNIDLEFREEENKQKNEIKTFERVDDLDRIKNLFKLYDLSIKESNLSVENLKEYNIDSTKFYQLFTNVGKERYFDLLLEFSFDIEKETNDELTKKYCKNFLSSLNAISDEKVICATLIVTNKLLKFIENKNFIYHFQKEISELYFKLLSKLRKDKNIFEKITEIYFNIPKYEENFSKEEIEKELNSLGIALNAFQTHKHGHIALLSIDIINYINRQTDSIKADECEYNQNHRLILKGFAAINYCRKYSEMGWTIDNFNIEYIIQDLENTIDFIIENHTKFNTYVYQRVISLIYFKNSIKFRYNQDNKKWNDVELIDKYLEEVKFIYDNNYYYLSDANYKFIEIIAQIQSFYNSLPIYNKKNIKAFFKKVFNEFKCSLSFPQLDTINELYGFSDDLDKLDIRYEVNKNRSYFEQVFLFSTQMLFSSSAVPYHERENDKYDSEILLEILKEGFPKHRVVEKNKNVHLVKSMIDLDYIY